jgi:hypothetical protein
MFLHRQIVNAPTDYGNACIVANLSSASEVAYEFCVKR